MAAKPHLILADRLIDGVSGVVQTDQAVLVRGTRIVAVGSRRIVEQQSPADTKRIDFGPACLTSGLIDVHTHASLPGDGRSYKEAFATATRP